MTEGKRVDINDYLSKFKPGQRELAKSVRQIILGSLPDLDEVVKWGHLVYERDRKICSIMIHKSHVNLQIWRGAELDDPETMLEGEGKNMRHVKVNSPEEVKKDYFEFLHKQAAELH
ncbi:MAG: DUF1801 domain-containing protein [Candidatus Thorarchaeota archaeon]